MSTWVVEVRLRPPPIHANFPARTCSAMLGSSVVSPRPQTKRGRTETVSKMSSSPAPRTAISALAFVAGYVDGESGRSVVR